MIVRMDKTYETNSMFLNKDWYSENNFVVDETSKEGIQLANKIMQHSPFFDFVVDEEGKLIDIIVLEKPFVPPTKNEINHQIITKIRERYSVNDEFKMQRLGIKDLDNAEYQEYIEYVKKCIGEGDKKKQKFGYGKTPQ